jgi:hypothetical protein
MVRHLAIEAESTKPEVGEVQVHLLAQPPFGTNSVAVANHQHPDQQFGINQRTTCAAIEWRHMAPDIRQINVWASTPSMLARPIRAARKRSIDLSKWVAGTCRSSANS